MYSCYSPPLAELSYCLACSIVDIEAFRVGAHTRKTKCA